MTVLQTSPLTDRGVTASHDEVATSIDWLNVTVWADPWDVAAVATEQLLGLERGGLDLWTFGGGGYFRGFQDRASAEGITLHMNPDGRVEGEADWCTLSIPGQPCREIGSRRLQGFLRTLTAQGWRWRVSRIDLAADGAGFTPVDFYSEVAAGRVRSGVHRRGQDEWLQLTRGHQGPDSSTVTVYFGRRASERFCRVYDKHGFTRFELEMKGDRAALVGQVFAERNEAYLPALVMGQIRDFCDLATEHRTGKARTWVLNSQWAAFIGAQTRLRLPISRAPLSLERAAHWVRTSVAPTLAAVCAAHGEAGGFIADVMAQGRQRWTSHHRLLMAQSQLPAFAAGGA